MSSNIRRGGLVDSYLQFLREGHLGGGFYHEETKKQSNTKMSFQPLSEQIERVGKTIVDAAFTVHTNLGPGLLEKVYEKCLVEELRLRNIYVERQVPVPIVYKGSEIDEDLKIDILVEHEIIVELKAVEVMHPVFDAQLLTYLKLTNRNLGYLINFNVPLIKDGIKRLRRNS